MILTKVATLNYFPSWVEEKITAFSSSKPEVDGVDLVLDLSPEKGLAMSGMADERRRLLGAHPAGTL